MPRSLSPFRAATPGPFAGTGPQTDARTGLPKTPAAQAGPPYRIPVRPLTPFYLTPPNPDGPGGDGPDGSSSDDDGGGGDDCKLKIRELMTDEREVISKPDREEPYETVVGRRVRLEVFAEGGGELTDIEWTVFDPGGVQNGQKKTAVIADYDLEDTPASHDSATVTPFETVDEREVSFYWLRGFAGRAGVGAVSVTAKVDGKNCRGAEADFDVEEPTVSIDPFFVSKEIYRGFFVEPYGCSSPPGGVPSTEPKHSGIKELSFGKVCEPNSGGGFVTSGKIQRLPNRTAGRVGLMQLANIDVLVGGAGGCRGASTAGQFVSDGRPDGPFYYPPLSHAAGASDIRAPMVDRPSFVLYPEEEFGRAEYSFQLFLMYRPAGPADETVWVTVGKLRWAFTVRVEKDGGAWPDRPQVGRLRIDPKDPLQPRAILPTPRLGGCRPRYPEKRSETLPVKQRLRASGERNPSRPTVDEHPRRRIMPRPPPPGFIPFWSWTRPDSPTSPAGVCHASEERTTKPNRLRVSGGGDRLRRVGRRRGGTAPRRAAARPAGADGKS